ncbi:MAG: serine hydrolase [Clostridia bacterium]|nr:serine hydrolase [Clostridia bacterium]
MFKTVTPESVGISSKNVRKFVNALEKRQMHMHSVILCRGYNIFGEFYWAPFKEDFCHRMYSQTKSFVSIAIGFLLDDGKLSLDDKIADYFPEKIHTPLHESLKKQTVRHMLTMSTIGYGESWFGKGNVDRAELYFKRQGTVRCPGTIWEYDSAGSQVLCCLVEKLAGMSLMDYLNKKLFCHLGTFKTATMLKTPSGESWGDSSLLCTTRDMLSFGRFVMNYGSWNGKQLLSEEYLRTATSKLVDNQEIAHYACTHHGYGYQIWRTEKNGFAFVGMGDELTVCLPDYDLIFTCTADNQGSDFSRSYILSCLFDIIVDNLSPSPIQESPMDYEELLRVAGGLKLFHLNGNNDSALREIINNKIFSFPENELGLKKLSFVFNGNEGGELHYTNNNGDLVLEFSINSNKFTKFPELGYSQDIGGIRTQDGSKYDCAVSAAWLQENKLMIFPQIIDRYFGNVSMCFAFNDGCITVTFYKTAEDFLWNYNGQAYGKME